MTPTRIELVSTILFGIAILHTFCASYFQELAGRHKEGSVAENFFHLLGEIEVVFGIWAGVLILYLAWSVGGKEAVSFVEAQNFTEPVFVFVIMVMAASQPCLYCFERILGAVARLIPLRGELPFFLVAMVIGPLMGSFFTEPAAMTVIALLLKDRIFDAGISERLRYAILGTLFVNVSIGGTLTPFAAPPVIMVAGTWGWDVAFMFSHFGWKAALAIVTSTGLLTYLFRKEIGSLPAKRKKRNEKMPLWVVVVHLIFLAVTIITAHYLAVFVGVFLFFLGVTAITQEYQSPLKLREGLLVGFFLGGLVVLGGTQRWWLEPLLPGLAPLGLFGSSIGLTAILDNAALTYLGSQVQGISDALKYALVAGAVTGGGLTVIANAPNPAGFGILKSSFENGISAAKLFVSALIPTAIAALAFWLL